MDLNLTRGTGITAVEGARNEELHSHVPRMVKEEGVVAILNVWVDASKKGFDPAALWSVEALDDAQRMKESVQD